MHKMDFRRFCGSKVLVARCECGLFRHRGPSSMQCVLTMEMLVGCSSAVQGRTLLHPLPEEGPLQCTCSGRAQASAMETRGRGRAKSIKDSSVRLTAQIKSDVLRFAEYDLDGNQHLDFDEFYAFQ